MPVPKHIDIDHPAVGAVHLFVPGNADSLVAAALMTARQRWPTWVMLAREHRLPVLLERPRHLQPGFEGVGRSAHGRPRRRPAVTARRSRSSSRPGSFGGMLEAC